MCMFIVCNLVTPWHFPMSHTPTVLPGALECSDSCWATLIYILGKIKNIH
uniref:Uncharacterized protein n=1 Tax=Rhizophora mucronata TaxID=61149 RepID=A0A2P2P5Z3_RHIMU